MPSVASPLTSGESTSIVKSINMSTMICGSDYSEYTTADEESSNSASPVPYITRTGKPIRNCPASSFLLQFQRAVPDTTSTSNIRAPNTTPESTASPYTSDVRSPVTEGTPNSNCGPLRAPGNVTANLTAASAYLRDFMLAGEDNDDEESSDDTQRITSRSKTVDLVVPRPVVAAAAINKLGKQVEEVEVRKIKEKRANGNADSDGASSNQSADDGKKARSRSGTATVAVSS